MHEHQLRSIEQANAHEYLRARLDAILDRPLTPEIIETYAEDALDNLVDLVSQVIAAFQAEGILDDHSMTREVEAAAFAHYGLDEIESILDHIAGKVDEIQGLDAIVQSAEVLPYVLVPPDPTSSKIEPGERKMKETGTLPRLKTVLFVLANEFGVDLPNPEQLHLRTGLPPPGAMREQAYYLLELPRLERLILVCDEENNATFVLNKLVCDELGLSTADIATITKNALNDLIQEESRIGRRLIYSSRFVPRFIAAIDSPGSNDEDVEAEMCSFLRPETLTEYKSRQGIAKELAIDPSAVFRAVDQLRDDLGEVHLGMGARKIPLYSPGQQARIRQQIEEWGVFDEPAPEMYGSVRDIAARLSVSEKSVAEATTAIRDKLGEVKTYRPSSGPSTLYYSPEQQVHIEAYLESRDTLAPPTPEGYLSAKELETYFNTSHYTIRNALDTLQGQLGDARVYRSNAGRPAVRYSPEQQAQIRAYLEDQHLLDSDVPDGYASIIALSGEFGCSRHAVKRAIDILGDKLGEISIYHTQSGPRPHYSPVQQEQIKGRLQELGYFLETAPSGYVSEYHMVRNLRVSPSLFAQAVAASRSTLGSVRVFRSKGGVSADGRTVRGVYYSPSQQAILTSWLSSYRPSSR